MPQERTDPYPPAQDPPKPHIATPARNATHPRRTGTP